MLGKVPAGNEAKPLSSDWRVRAPVWLIAIYVSVICLQAASSLFLWIFCSIFLYILIEPLVRWLARKGIPSIFGALAMVAAVIILLGVFALVIHQNTEDIHNALVSYKDALLKLYEAANTAVAKFTPSHLGLESPALNPGAKIAKVQVVNTGGIDASFFGGLLPHVGSLVEGIAFVLLCPILTFFFFAERSGIQRAVAKMIADEAIRKKWWGDICQAVRAFFVGNLVLAVASWPVFALAFFLFGLPSWLTFSVMAAVFNVIPFLGAPLAAALPILEYFSAGGGVGGILGIVGVSFLIHFLIANLVTPKVLGSKVDLNAWVSTIAIVAWGMIWGGVGLVLAVPLTAMLKISFQYSNSDVLQWLSLLMSDDQESWEERAKLLNPMRAFSSKFPGRYPLNAGEAKK